MPHIWEKDARGEKQYDIFSRLLKDRIVFVGPRPNGSHSIDGVSANYAIAQILYLMSDNKNQDINLYINSPGGSVSAGLALYDTMQFVPCDIATYCLGQACSMGAVLLAGGTKGKRHALPNSRIMIHQPMGWSEGTASDILISAKELKYTKKRLSEILAEHTGKKLKQIEKDTDRDFFMGAEEAKKYGIVDEVLSTLKEPKDE